MVMYHIDHRRLQPGDIVLIRVVIDDMTKTGSDFVPVEVLAVKDHRAEIVLCSSVSRTCHWVSVEKIFQKR